MHRTILILALSMLGTPAWAGVRTVAFETDNTTVTEGDAVTVTVTISEPPPLLTHVTVVSETNTAHEHVDFDEVDEVLYWEPGDGSSRQFEVRTIADDIPEEFEWFDLRFSERSPDTDIGEPSTMTIYIPNDDGFGELVAWIDVDNAFEDDGTFTFYAEAGSTFEIPVRLNRIPNPPATVDF